MNYTLPYYADLGSISDLYHGIQISPIANIFKEILLIWILPEQLKSPAQLKG